MSTLTYAVRDAGTMLRRDVRHSLRYPAMTISDIRCRTTGTPVADQATVGESSSRRRMAARPGWGRWGGLGRVAPAK
jgi:hypothetical protein